MSSSASSCRKGQHCPLASCAPHALKGAVISLAVMWRLPVLYARDPEDSLRILRDLANQANAAGGFLKTYDRKPKRVVARKLYMLQGLPGVGPGPHLHR